MNILIACEESQKVCNAFRRRGHNAFSCDIQECSGGHPEWHIQCDVLKILNPKNNVKPLITLYGNTSYAIRGIYFKTCDNAEHFVTRWDMIIAFPPCTDLCNSGQWAYSKGKDITLREKAVDFFMEIANADCDKIVIENPVGIMSNRWRKPDQIIHPWQFGDNAQKRTCLWLKGVPVLIPTVTIKPEIKYFEWVDKRTGKIKRMEQWMYHTRCFTDKKEAAKIASKTFDGIADAMGEQWG